MVECKPTQLFFEAIPYTTCCLWCEGVRGGLWQGQRKQTHSQRDVGGDGDAGAEANVPVAVHNHQPGVPLDFSLHPHSTAKISTWLQSSCQIN